MKLYLESLSLSGYRSYDNDIARNHIQLGQMNIVIGANGAGKSNLISFFEMIAFMMTKGLRNYIAQRGGAQGQLYFGAKVTERVCGLLQLCDSDSKCRDTYKFSLGMSITDQMFFEEETMSYQKTGHSHSYWKDFGKGHMESGMAEEDDDPTVRFLRNSLKQLRVFHFNDTSLSARIRIGGDVFDNAYLRSDAGNLAAFLYRIQKEKPSYYTRIMRYIRMVMPQFLEFYLQPDLNGRIMLRWQPHGGEEVLGAQHLSDGTLRFMALTTLLLQPEENSPATIILDEPEIGLHPQAMALLAKEMRMANKTSQLIVATQSPLLLNYFRPEDIITADYDTGARRTRLTRQSAECLEAWMEEYSLGELWEKNVLGGLPL